MAFDCARVWQNSKVDNHLIKHFRALSKREMLGDQTRSNIVWPVIKHVDVELRGQMVSNS